MSNIRISYMVTVNDEISEISRLVENLKNNIRPEDEIVIQQDSTNLNSEVEEYCNKLDGSIKYIQFPLNGDFASFKNNAVRHCSGDWIVQVDADETVSEVLLQNLPNILDDNPYSDMIAIPRINTVEGLTAQDINRWRWQVNESGWINFPDYQQRIFRNNNEIFWVNKVHEVLKGYRKFSAFPSEEEYCLYHHKHIIKQREQNKFYETL